MVRWETETRELPEACEPASLKYATVNSKKTVSKAEKKAQHLRLFSDLHTCAMAPALRHMNIHIHPV